MNQKTRSQETESTHYFITGGTGLIGSRFIKSLPSEASVTVLTRRPKNVTIPADCSLSFVNRINQVDFNTVEHVINLAGEPIDKRWTTSNKRKIENSRWDTTQQLTDAINQATQKPQTFISGSAIGIYGRQTSIKIAEDYDQYHDEFSHRLCKKWEDIASSASQSSRVVLLRTGVVLAKGRGALAKMVPPFQFFAGAVTGGGKQYMAWIDLDDMVRLIHHCVNNHSITGPVNATAPHPVTNQEFSTTLARTLNRPCWFKLPSFFVKFAFGEMSDLLLYGQNVIPSKLLASGFEFKYPKLSDSLSHQFN
ncbi:MAG: TIGR01777 family oxidoreductase [Kangiellaceae bacterium]|jgi:uncharacterized protein (TIGR01777 family)|nr:TIGR01777 family oxidoreductase [Kangiellaceae bacterium]